MDHINLCPDSHATLITSYDCSIQIRDEKTPLQCHFFLWKFLLSYIYLIINVIKFREPLA